MSTTCEQIIGLENYKYVHEFFLFKFNFNPKSLFSFQKIDYLKKMNQRQRPV